MQPFAEIAMFSFFLVNSCPERSHFNNTTRRCKFSPNGSRRHAQSPVLLLKLHHSLTSRRYDRALPTVPRDSRQHRGTGKRVWTGCKTAGFHSRMGQEYSIFLRVHASRSIHLATLVLEWIVHIKRCPALFAVSHGATADHKRADASVEHGFVGSDQ